MEGASGRPDPGNVTPTPDQAALSPESLAPVVPRQSNPRPKPNVVVRRLAKQGLWVWIAGFIPFLIIVAFRGWHETFRNGDAFLYAAGLAVAATYENVLARRENPDVKPTNASVDWNAVGRSIGVYVPLVACFLVCLWFSVKQPDVKDPTTSWVQILVFYLAVSYAGGVRFVRTRADPMALDTGPGTR